ncbi:hypothetical protein Tco_1367223, partial [Tanacetum coccineum]
MQKESVSKQRRKPAKSAPTVHKDPSFDDLDDIVDDAMDYMDTEDAQYEGRTSSVVLEEKENAEKGVITEDQVSTVKPDEVTNKSKVSTDKLEVSTVKPKKIEVSTDKLDEGTAKPKDGTSDESIVPTTVFKDDDTIAEFLVSMSQNKAKQKAVEIKDAEDSDRPRATLTRSVLTLKPLPKINPKDKGKKVLKEEAESDAESGELMKLKERGKKHADLKNKNFEEIQIKEMNDESKDPKKKRVVNETPREEDTTKVPAEQEVTEQGTKKRKNGHVKMIARKRPRPQPDDNSDDEHRKYLRIVTFDSTLDSEIMEIKSFVSKLHKVSSPDGDYLVVYKVNRHFRAFNYLMEVLHIFDRHDLFHLYDLVMKQYSEITREGIELILWGDLKIMMESSIEENDQELKDGTVIYMLVERRYPLSKELLQRMLDLGLEVEEESTVALYLDQTVSIVQKQMVFGKDKLNPLIVDSLLKTIRLSIHLVVYNEELAIPEQTATGKGLSNPLMAVSVELSILATTLNMPERSILIRIYRVEGAAELRRWFEKTESVFEISECVEGKKVKFATATLEGPALTWWKTKVASMGLVSHPAKAETRGVMRTNIITTQ